MTRDLILLAGLVAMVLWYGWAWTQERTTQMCIAALGAFVLGGFMGAC